MTIGKLYSKLQEEIGKGHGDYAVMIKVGNNRDLIVDIGDAHVFINYTSGWVELESANELNFTD